MRRLITSIAFGALAQCAALGQGESVAVLFNSKLPESRAVAEHYAKLRGIPANHLIGLPLSDGHTISRREFTVKLEQPLAADVALLRAKQGDRWGNLTFHTAARNFNPVMATAAKTVVVEVGQVVELGELHPEHIVTPGIFVDHIIEIEPIFP